MKDSFAPTPASLKHRERAVIKTAVARKIFPGVAVFALILATSMPRSGAAHAAVAPAAQNSVQTTVQTTWRLLDYIAVDYKGAVANGEIVSQSEYAEMVEFSNSASERIAALAPSPQSPGLTRQGVALQQLIGSKAPAEEVATSARALAAALIEAYPVPLAPAAPPDFARGRALYERDCTSCHGATGHGDGPAAEALDPPPIAFADETRARERSIFALYQVIGQGIDGTAMASFARLPAEDRWALALYSGTFAYPVEDAAEGERIWNSDAALRDRLGLDELVDLTPAALASDIGAAKASAVVAYLRRHPDAVKASSNESLALAQERLDASAAAYERGDRESATELALSAYLDGFEPVEPILSARNSALMVQIEGAMGAVRTAMDQGEPSDSVRARIETLHGLFAQAETELASNAASSASGFIAAFTILLREGLEALLIVVAMIAFLTKAERREMVPWVHGGWTVALIAGGATWAAATWLITFSGASRELTEGFGSLLAAVVLIWVGIWMHGKSQAEAWQRYIREKLSRALTRRSAWVLFGLAFLVVYREVFETILFYIAIWSDGNRGAVVSGAGAAVLLLAVIAWAMMRYSRTMPIGQFFRYSALLMAALAVVLIGKSVSSLQEVGYLPLAYLDWAPRIQILGVYPTLQGIFAQCLVAAIILAGFLLSQRKPPAPLSNP